MLDELCSKVVQWGDARGIISEDNATYQMDKMDEEVTELYHEVFYGNRDGVLDELGDVLVTCVIQAACWGTNIQECLELAYQKISKRTGVVKNGVFVKDE